MLLRRRYLLVIWFIAWGPLQSCVQGTPGPLLRESQTPCTCADLAPPEHSCERQRDHGLCNSKEMLKGGFCAATCQRCVCFGDCQCVDKLPATGQTCLDLKEAGGCGSDAITRGNLCSLSCRTCPCLKALGPDLFAPEPINPQAVTTAPRDVSGVMPSGLQPQTLPSRGVVDPENSADVGGPGQPITTQQSTLTLPSSVPAGGILDPSRTASNQMPMTQQTATLATNPTIPSTIPSLLPATTIATPTAPSSTLPLTSALLPTTNIDTSSGPGGQLGREGPIQAGATLGTTANTVTPGLGGADAARLTQPVRPDENTLDGVAGVGAVAPVGGVDTLRLGSDGDVLDGLGGVGPASRGALPGSTASGTTTGLNARIIPVPVDGVAGVQRIGGVQQPGQGESVDAGPIQAAVAGGAAISTTSLGPVNGGDAKAVAGMQPVRSAGPATAGSVPAKPGAPVPAAAAVGLNKGLGMDSKPLLQQSVFGGAVSNRA